MSSYFRAAYLVGLYNTFQKLDTNAKGWFLETEVCFRSNLLSKKISNYNN